MSGYTQIAPYIQYRDNVYYNIRALNLSYCFYY